MYWWIDTIATFRGEYHKAKRKSQRTRGKNSHAILVQKHKNELLSIMDDDPWDRPYKVVMTRMES